MLTSIKMNYFLLNVIWFDNLKISFNLCVKKTNLADDGGKWWTVWPSMVVNSGW